MTSRIRFERFILRCFPVSCALTERLILVGALDPESTLCHDFSLSDNLSPRRPARPYLTGLTACIDIFDTPLKRWITPNDFLVTTGAAIQTDHGDVKCGESRFCAGAVPCRAGPDGFGGQR